MKSFEYSGSPHSEVNKARWDYHMARYFALPAANAGKIPKGEAMAMLNKARAALKTAVYGKSRTYYVDYHTRVSGIPCGAVSTDEGFILVDRSGYRAKWLEDKMSEAEKDAITLRIEWSEENKYEAV